MPDIPFFERTQADVIRWQVSQARKHNPGGIMWLSLRWLSEDMARAAPKKRGRRPGTRDHSGEAFVDWLDESREWEGERELNKFRDTELLSRHLREYLA